MTYDPLPICFWKQNIRQIFGAIYSILWTFEEEKFDQERYRSTPSVSEIENIYFVKQWWQCVTSNKQRTSISSDRQIKRYKQYKKQQKYLHIICSCLIVIPQKKSVGFTEFRQEGLYKSTFARVWKHPSQSSKNRNLFKLMEMSQIVLFLKRSGNTWKVPNFNTLYRAQFWSRKID